LPGKPDIVLPSRRKIIFVHGCFWHGHPGCRHAARPTSNVEFWNKKIDANIRRDTAAQQELAAIGWQSLVIWQCEIRDQDVLKAHLQQFLTDAGCT